MIKNIFNKTPENPLLELRTKILSCETKLEEYSGPKQISAIVTDIGSKKGGISLLCIADGTCSLYFEKGGGIIGTGAHKNVYYTAKIFMNRITQLIENPVDAFNINFPKNDIFSVKILTKDLKYEIEGEITDSLSGSTIPGMAFILANDVITQIRLIAQNEYKEFSNDEILISFIKHNYYEAFLMALEDLNNPDALEEDKSALIISVYTGNIRITELLIRHGADLNYKDKTGMNSLMFACFLGKHDLVNLLSDASTLNSNDNFGYTPLMFACNAGKYECVEKLINLKADVNAKDNDNSTAIMFAAQHGYDSIVNLLINNGADKSITGNHGLTALDFAIQNKHNSTIALLQK